jgi:hypothetical protein
LKVERVIGPALALTLLACSSGTSSGGPSGAGSAAAGSGGANAGAAGSSVSAGAGSAAAGAAAAGAAASGAGGKSANGGSSGAPVHAAGSSGSAAGSGGAAASAGGASGASGSAAGLPACTASIGSCPAHSVGIWQELLKATDLGANARLVATGGLGVLGALGDGSFRVARLNDPAEAASGPAYTAWDFPNASAQAKPVAIMEGRLSDITPVPPNELIVLTCADTRAHCSIWRSAVNAGQLSSWEETPLPAEFSAGGVALDGGVEPRQICVYGGGMYCWTDHWQEAIPSAQALRVNDVAFGPLWSLAVGDHGRWFKRAHDAGGTLSAWLEQPPLNDIALSQVSVAADGGVIVGAGKLQAALGTQAPLYDCSVSDDLAGFLVDPGVRGLAYAVTNTGKILQHALTSAQRSEAYCAYQQLTLSGAVLDSGAVPCSASNNPRLLTDSGLFGQSQCLMTQ